MLVITGIITDRVSDNLFSADENEIIVQKTISFFDSGMLSYIPAPVIGAKVWLDDVLLSDMNNGRYKIPDEDFCGVPGQTYTLEVHYDMDEDGIEEVYTSSTTMPKACQLDSIRLMPLPVIRREYMAMLMLHYQDDGAEQRYYCAKLRDDDNGFYYSGRILRYSLFRSSATPSDNASRQTPSGWSIRHEMQFDNERIYNIFAGDLLMVELESLSLELYEYLSAASTELRQNNPLFSGPRTDLPTNIRGGAIGVFGSYTTNRVSLQIPLDTPGLPIRP